MMKPRAGPNVNVFGSKTKTFSPPFVITPPIDARFPCPVVEPATRRHVTSPDTTTFGSRSVSVCLNVPLAAVPTALLTALKVMSTCEQLTEHTCVIRPLAESRTGSAEAGDAVSANDANTASMTRTFARVRPIKIPTIWLPSRFCRREVPRLGEALQGECPTQRFVSSV